MNRSVGEVHSTVRTHEVFLNLRQITNRKGYRKMTINIIALALTAGICTVLPIIFFFVLWIKNTKERKGITLLFFMGSVIYLAMQWGIKERGLIYLVNHTEFAQFINDHYLSYLLLVAFAGALLSMLPEFLVIRFLMKRQVSFKESIAFGLGYGMTESILLVGWSSIVAIIELLRHEGNELNVSATDLFLSGYERLLVMLIEIGVITVYVFFIDQKMAGRGSVIEVLCQTLLMFLPGFFVAFSLSDFYEIYDRFVALLLLYVVLTAAAVSAVIVLNSLKYSLTDTLFGRKKTERK